MVEKVAVTALGIGGATVLGAFIGLIMRDAAAKFDGLMMGLASGIMLAAAGMGLISPAAERTNCLWTVGAGMMMGAAFIRMMDGFSVRAAKMLGIDADEGAGVVLLVLAVALHNLPEGMAAGIALGGGDPSGALAVAAGVILHNLPEGMMIITPLLKAGAGTGRTVQIAVLTGLSEVVGTVIGYCAAGISAWMLPFALSFAGGTMLYIIGDEMIPQQRMRGSGGTFAMVAGYFIMLAAESFAA